MNTQAPTPPPKFRPLNADELTPELIEEALHISKRYDRNLLNKDGEDAFPVPCRTARLMALTIINLHTKLGAGRVPVGKAQPTEKEKVSKAIATKKKKKPTKPEPQAPLSEEQTRAFHAIKDILAEKQVVTTRGVAEKGGWKSHNSSARHIKSLVDLGYLKYVGKQRVIALTGLEP